MNTNNIREELKDYATEYDIGQYTISFRSKNKWAVLDFYKNCYAKDDKDFMVEPRPSNRDDKFLNNCRFSLKEAKDIVEGLQK